RQDRGQKDIWDLYKQCMHMLSPCCCVPQMDNGMHYEERRTGLRCWPRCRVKRKPRQRHSGHDVHSAKVADEMVIKSACLANARNRAYQTAVAKSITKPLTVNATPRIHATMLRMSLLLPA